MKESVMTVEELIAGNKLIVLFMGLHVHGKHGTLVAVPIKNGKGYYTDTLEMLEYRTSWDALVPVGKKALGLSLEIKSTESLNHSSDMMNALYTLECENMWEAVVEFIKWYNENHKD